MVEKIYLVKLGQNIFIKKINIFQIVHSLNSLLHSCLENGPNIAFVVLFAEFKFAYLLIYSTRVVRLVVILVPGVSTISLQIRVAI